MSAAKGFGEAMAMMNDYIDNEKAMHAELRYLLLANGFAKETAIEAADFYIRMRDQSPKKKEWEN